MMNLSRRTLLSMSVATLISGDASQAFGQDHPRIGLIFVGASWCPVCHVAAAVLAPAAERSDMDILVASQDGKAIKPWVDFVDARGNPLTQRIRAIPTALLHNSGLGGFTS